MAFIEQSCPLCGFPAIYCLTRLAERKYFTCDSHCKEFQVSIRAERELALHSQAYRSQLSGKAARAFAVDQVLVIRIPTPPDDRPLVEEVLPRDQVPDCKTP